MNYNTMNLQQPFIVPWVNFSAMASPAALVAAAAAQQQQQHQQQQPTQQQQQQHVINAGQHLNSSYQLQKMLPFSALQVANHQAAAACLPLQLAQMQAAAAAAQYHNSLSSAPQTMSQAMVTSYGQHQHVTAMPTYTAAGINGNMYSTSPTSAAVAALSQAQALQAMGHHHQHVNGLVSNHVTLSPSMTLSHPASAMHKLLSLPPPKDGSSSATSVLAAAAAAAALNGFPLSNVKITEKRKLIEEIALADVKKAKMETKALKAKRPGFSDDRYNETQYYVENGLRKVYPYYFTFTTFTKGRWVGEKILEVFGREFRAHPVEEYERCILDGTLTVNYEQVDVDYRLRHNDLLANIVHRHETPVLSKPIELIHLSEDLVVLDKPCSLPVHPCGRYRHNTVVFILAKEYNLRNLRTIHRLDRLTSGLLMFGRNPRKARDMEQQIRNRQVLKEYICRVEGEFPEGITECTQPVEVVSYKIGVCKVSPHGKECRTEFERLNYSNGTSVVVCRPFTGRMHQIRVHLQYLGYPVMNDPLYNHTVFGPNKGKGGLIGKSDEKLIQDLIAIHNAENWLGMDGDSELSMFNKDNEKKSCMDDAADDVMNVGPPKMNGHTPPVGATIIEIDPRNPMSSLENNPNVPRNCTITRPPPITRPGRSVGSREPVVLRQPLETESSEPITEQDNELLSRHREYRYMPDKMTWDPNCYECKVRYRDPKANDLVMYLHAWRYKGPDWEFQTKLPIWADVNWTAPE